MKPEYLRELADLADPDQLWRLSGEDQMALDDRQKAQVSTGVALRRYAREVETLQLLLGTGQSLLLTPLGTNSRAVTAIETPDIHKHLLRG